MMNNFVQTILSHQRLGSTNQWCLKYSCFVVLGLKLEIRVFSCHPMLFPHIGQIPLYPLFFKKERPQKQTKKLKSLYEIHLQFSSNKKYSMYLWNLKKDRVNFDHIQSRKYLMGIKANLFIIKGWFFGVVSFFDLMHFRKNTLLVLNHNS